MTLSALAAAVLAGCRKQYYYVSHDDLAYYRNAATGVEYPDVHVPSSPTVASQPPRTLRDPGTEVVWDLPLKEAVRVALCNSEVIRGSFFPSTSTVSSPATVSSSRPTIYDPAITDTDPVRGVEAALSAFDASFEVQTLWGRSETPTSTVLQAGAGVAAFLSETFQGQAALTKPFATGGEAALRFNTDYLFSNSTLQTVNPRYASNVEFSFNQPLLRGAGEAFNRAPVLIARVDTDIAIADFQVAVRNLLSDVENAYWQLYFQYRLLDAQRAARDRALATWRKEKAALDVGRGAVPNEAQAREQYFRFARETDRALDQVYVIEAELRRLVGLPPNDGKLIRPADEPTTAEFVPDWYVALGEALTLREEVRRQKWVVRRREIELLSAKNGLLPQLDFVSLYRINGLGGTSPPPGSPANAPFTDSLEMITEGDFTDWQLGLQLTVPIGFRQAQSAVRNAKLQLIRERAILQNIEHDATHILANAVRNLHAQYEFVVKSLNLRQAALDNLLAQEAIYQEGRTTLDILLEAQERLAQDEQEYYRELTEYNKWLMGFQREKGTLLAYNGVNIGEGPWNEKAYVDARRRARQREVSIPNPLIKDSVPPPVVDPNQPGRTPAADTDSAPPAPAETSPTDPPTPPPADGQPPGDAAPAQEPIPAPAP